MVQTISEKEAKKNKKELDEWIMSLDYNTKCHIKGIIEPFIKQINCFHEWFVPNYDKTKLYCKHCNLKKDVDFLKVSKWLSEATDIYNSKTTMFEIDIQTLIIFLKFTENQLCKLYRSKITSTELADLAIFNHLSKISSSNKEIQNKNELFLKKFKASNVLNKIKEEYKKKCKDCKTIFLYKKNDVKSDRDGQYVICPLCKKFIQTENFK